MNLLITGDLHLRYLPPENRTEEAFFESVVMDKLTQIVRIAKENNCQYILQPGDFWDSPNTPRFVISRVIRLLRQEGLHVLTVLGQHDLLFRNFDRIDRTATHLLESAGVATILDPPSSVFQIPGSNVYCCGLSYGREYSWNLDKEKEYILLAHASVGTRPLFPGHALESPESFMRKNRGFELIVVGDYHYTFVGHDKSGWIVNPGVLIRKTTRPEELDHRPCVYIFNTQTKMLPRIELRIHPSSEAFRIGLQKGDSQQSTLQQFIELMRAEKKLAVSFEDNLVLYYKTNKVSEGAKQVISAMLAEVAGKEKEV